MREFLFVFRAGPDSLSKGSEEPSFEMQGSVLGYSVIKANSWEVAVEIAKESPVFRSNCAVEAKLISLL
jgi:hypothetical protein